MSLYTYPSGQVTLITPPSGFVANFEHPQRQYAEPIYWASGALFILSCLFMGQRGYTNAFINRKFFIEDVLLLISWLLIILENILILRTVVDGTMGTHAYELVISDFLKFEHNFYPMPIIYPLCIMFAKTSLLSFYLRLDPARTFQFAVYFGLFFVICSSLSLIFATAFPCKPLEAAWNPLIEARCINRAATYKATASIGLAADIYIIVLPIPTVVGLFMPVQQKVGIILAFSVGVLTIVTSIIRLIIIISELSDADVSWGAAPTAFWLIIEAYLMVICATLTSIRRFFKHFAPRLIGERSSGSNSDAQKQNSQLVTIGGSNSKYNKFSRNNGYNESYGMENIITTRIDEQADQEDGQENHDANSGDGNSQKGILQTHTTTVVYETRQIP